MTRVLVALFGILPAILLALLALIPLLAGLANLFDDPAFGGLYFVWGLAGLVGTHTLIQVARGTYTEDTVPGLLAGIGAAAPLVWIVLDNVALLDAPLLLYVTAGPIVVAAGYLADMLLFEPAGNARIIEFEEL